MASIFSKIINREIPGHFVYEDDVCVAILDKFPSVRGQTLVIPKEEIDYVGDLSDDTLAHLIVVAKRAAKALDVTFSAIRTCMVIEGFEVPHVHIKLYPIQSNDRPLGHILKMGSEAEDDTLRAQASDIKRNWV